MKLLNKKTVLLFLTLSVLCTCIGAMMKICHSPIADIVLIGGMILNCGFVILLGVLIYKKL